MNGLCIVLVVSYISSVSNQKKKLQGLNNVHKLL
jgi:hypothetical protein